MTALLLIALAVGLVWGLIYVLRGSLLAGCTALIVVGYCFGHNFVNFDLGPLPLTVDRLLLGVLLGVYVVQRWLGRLDPKPFAATDWLLLAFVGVLVASTFTHDWRLSAPGKISPLWLLVAGYLTPIAIYFMVRDCRLTDRNVTHAYWMLFGLGVYLSLTALAETAGAWWAVFPKYISDPKVGIHFGRARGPALQSHSLGFYLVFTMLCGWALWPKLRRPGQLMLAGFTPVFLAAIYFTYTRCAWLALALAAFVLMALWLRGAWRPLALGAALTVSVLSAVLLWDQVVGIEREAGAVAARDSVSQRGSFTYVSWKMFLDAPLFGRGFGQFPEAKLPYLSDRSTELYLEAIRPQPHHNTFLSLLTETGLVGLGLYLAVFAGLARTGWRMWRSPVATDLVRMQGLLMIAGLAAYLSPALFFDLTYSPQDHWLFFLLAGLTMGLAPQAVSAAANSTASPVGRWFDRFRTPAPHGV